VPRAAHLVALEREFADGRRTEHDTHLTFAALRHDDVRIRADDAEPVRGVITLMRNSTVSPSVSRISDGLNENRSARTGMTRDGDSAGDCAAPNVNVDTSTTIPASRILASFMTVSTVNREPSRL
jgi:hypothetical protein